MTPRCNHATRRRRRALLFFVDASHDTWMDPIGFWNGLTILGNCHGTRRQRGISICLFFMSFFSVWSSWYYHWMICRCITCNPVRYDHFLNHLDNTLTTSDEITWHFVDAIAPFYALTLSRDFVPMLSYDGCLPLVVFRVSINDGYSLVFIFKTFIFSCCYCCFLPQFFQTDRACITIQHFPDNRQ